MCMIYVLEIWFSGTWKCENHDNHFLIEVFGWYSQILNSIILRSLRRGKENEKYVFICCVLQRVVLSMKTLTKTCLNMSLCQKNSYIKVSNVENDTKRTFNQWIKV